jgi:recombination protein RecT
MTDKEKQQHDKLAKQPVSVLDYVRAATKTITARLPGNIDPEKFILGLMTAIQKSQANSEPGKSLADCDPKSVLLAAYDAAEQGCSLSPSLALGWLIKYGREAQFQPSYRFFIQRAYQTGEVRAFFAEVVYKGDEFKRVLAPERSLHHVPGSEPATRENALGAYALIQFTDGTLEFEYLTTEQIEKHRNCSKNPNSLMWVQFWTEGYRKTPIRVLAKRLPLKSRKMEEFVEVVNRDADRDLVIPVESYQEPTPPRRVQEEQGGAKETKAAPETADKEQPKEKQEPEKPAEKKNGGLFQSESADGEFLSPGDIREFWNKAVAAGWKKEEVLTMLKKDFSVEALKDLPKAKMQSALDVIQSARG